MSDEKFEQFLQREARSYNEPPAGVPRDEMFAAITAARATAAASGLREGGSRKAGSPRARLAWIGMAATLAIGVAIGKYGFTRRDATGPAALVTNTSSRANALPADSNAGTYAVAAAEQLARAEALLTAYSASGAKSGVDKQLSGWARDILANTRLLLDSPAADDPARRRLLRDLELVLVQMVQRSPADGAADERSQIDRSLERTQVLPRLRSALPAGRNSGI
jgi:hypothetical protein